MGGEGGRMGGVGIRVGRGDRVGSGERERGEGVGWGVGRGDGERG